MESGETMTATPLRFMLLVLAVIASQVVLALAFLHWIDSQAEKARVNEL